MPSVLAEVPFSIYISSRSALFFAFAACLFTYRFLQKHRRNQLDEVFAVAHGCLPVESKLPYKWPFALDILKRQYDAIPSQRLLAFQSQFFDQMGPIMELRLFGQVGYMTTDPRNVEAINSSRFNDFGMGSRRAGLFPMLGEGIFTQDGPAWKHSRELLRRQFVRVPYHDLKIFEEHVESLIASFATAKGVVDLQPAFFRFTLATTTSLLFGESVGSLGEDVQTEFAESFDHASFISAIRLRLADFCWVYTPSKFKKSCEVVKKYAGYFVEKALNDMQKNGVEEASSRYPFILDLYADLKDPDKVRDQLVNVLIAGRDTTACLLSWAFFLLVRHPATLERLRQEVYSVTRGDRNISRAHLLKMPYLKCVLDETMRLYPQLPVNVRVAVQTTCLPSGGGPDGTAPVLIKQGTGVGTSIYHMHRRKELYGADANEFRPERWLGHELDKIGCGFMPFHYGPRICLGKDYAIAEASYAVVRMIQSYPNIRLPPDIIPEPTGQEKQTLTIVVSSAEGCKVLLD